MTYPFLRIFDGELSSARTVNSLSTAGWYQNLVFSVRLDAVSPPKNFEPGSPPGPGLHLNPGLVHSMTGVSRHFFVTEFNPPLRATVSQLDSELCLDPIQDSRNTNTAVRNIFFPQNYPQEHQHTVSYKLAHFDVTFGLRDPSVFWPKKHA